MSLPLFLYTSKKICCGAGHLQSHGKTAQGAHPCAAADGALAAFWRKGEERRAGLQTAAGPGMSLQKSGAGRRMRKVDPSQLDWPQSVCKLSRSWNHLCDYYHRALDSQMHVLCVHSLPFLLPGRILQVMCIFTVMATFWLS